ncbi:ATP-binding protein [Desulfosporosinus hippei]|uniref:Circadian input-output histidine kinase CikA n=1 Tax=Desulfosporosinus hippei DSM 8344 TaxID=1121419 RepID=A0A1G8BG41_9FIRM|nr:ATP-binding protein [Desulfosporosinus hippei]SDH32024.1 Signal transduction histidine kinase [Desulfosporosinus hippei DSM 8344]
MTKFKTFHQKHLNSQIILIVTFIVIGFMSVYIGWGSYNQYQLAFKNLHNSTSMLAQELIATRVFIAEKQNVINLDKNGAVNFKHFNPSVAIRGISEIFNGTLGYTFKQTRFQVRNPVNAPDPYELEILEKFAQDRSLTEYASVDSVNELKSYRYMVPLYFEKDCLSCHGEPLGEIDISGYAKEGAQLGDFAGAISITAPLDQTYKDLIISLKHNILSTLILLLSLTIAVFLSIRSKVVKPLENMANLATRIGKGDLSIPETTIAHNYEIGVLQNSLYTTANNLKVLYETLESQVDERTKELLRANQALHLHQESQYRINKELTKANEVKSEFIALMSHELQTPLTSIIAYSEILIHQGTNVPEASEYLFDIYQSAHHLLDLITDLLDFSKLEKNKVNLHPTFFEFSEITAILLNIFRPFIQNNNLQLSFNLPSDLPVIEADKNKIKQALMNLLSNAIKFTPSGGSIHLQVLYNEDKEEIQVSICDTGRGIEADKLNQVFGKFFQVDSGTSREFGGLGLGLAVAKQMIELHGGRIWVESVLGQGSAFHFTLPISCSPKPAIELEG